jgi:hypothetical protein
MKAALEAWGANSNPFHQGAKESDDCEVVAATMSKPGVIPRRPVGPFTENVDLPEQQTERKHAGSTKEPRGSAKASAGPTRQFLGYARSDFRYFDSVGSALRRGPAPTTKCWRRARGTNLDRIDDLIRKSIA